MGTPPDKEKGEKTAGARPQYGTKRWKPVIYATSTPPDNGLVFFPDGISP
jgi:hypothetical protein